MSVVSATAPSAVAALPQSSNLAKTSKSHSVEQQFLQYAEETPAQRLFDSMLGQLGITEDQFKAMSPADQQKVTEKIQQMIQRQAEINGDKRTGLLTDKTV
jgi:hypothetical protein